VCVCVCVRVSECVYGCAGVYRGVLNTTVRAFFKKMLDVLSFVEKSWNRFESTRIASNLSMNHF
jgi:hypothetical protein